MAGQCVVEEVATQHSICAVVALYKDDQESSPRVAGRGPTMLVLTCAVVALYKDDQESSPRVAGPGPTMLVLTCAVVALYNDDQESSPRVAGPGPTMLVLTCAAMGGCVKILNSLQSQYIIIISKLCHLIKSIFCVRM